MKLLDDEGRLFGVVNVIDVSLPVADRRTRSGSDRDRPSGHVDGRAVYRDFRSSRRLFRTRHPRSAAVALGSTLADRTLAAPVRIAGFAALFVALLAIPSALLLDQTTALLFAVGLLVVGTIALFEDPPWEQLRETRPIELLIAAFEPPEPPDAETDEDDRRPAFTDRE